MQPGSVTDSTSEHDMPTLQHRASNASLSSSSAVDHARTRAQLAVLRSALLKEQELARSLGASVRQRDQQLRDASQERDLLIVRNDHLARRIDAMRKPQSSIPSSKTGSSTGLFAVLGIGSKDKPQRNEDLEIVFSQMEEKAIENEELKEQLKSSESHANSILVRLTESHDALSSLSSKHDALIANNAQLTAQIQKLRDSFEYQKKVLSSRVESHGRVIEEWQAYGRSVQSLASSLCGDNPPPRDLNALYNRFISYLRDFREYSVRFFELEDRDTRPANAAFEGLQSLKSLQTDLFTLRTIHTGFKSVVDAQRTLLSQSTSPVSKSVSLPESWNDSIAQDLKKLDVTFEEILICFQTVIAPDTDEILKTSSLLRVSMLMSQYHYSWTNLARHWKFKFMNGTTISPKATRILECFPESEKLRKLDSMNGVKSVDSMSKVSVDEQSEAAAYQVAHSLVDLHVKRFEAEWRAIQVPAKIDASIQATPSLLHSSTQIHAIVVSDTESQCEPTISKDFGTQSFPAVTTNEQFMQTENLIAPTNSETQTSTLQLSDANTQFEQIHVASQSCQTPMGHGRDQSQGTPDSIYLLETSSPALYEAGSSPMRVSDMAVQTDVFASNLHDTSTENADDDITSVPGGAMSFDEITADSTITSPSLGNSTRNGTTSSSAAKKKKGKKKKSTAASNSTPSPVGRESPAQMESGQEHVPVDSIPNLMPELTPKPDLHFAETQTDHDLSASNDSLMANRTTFKVTASAALDRLVLPLSAFTMNMDSAPSGQPSDSVQHVSIVKEGYLDDVWDMERIKDVLEHSRLMKAKAARLERLLAEQGSLGLRNGGNTEHMKSPLAHLVILSALLLTVIEPVALADTQHLNKRSVHHAAGHPVKAAAVHAAIKTSKSLKTTKTVKTLGKTSKAKTTKYTATKSKSKVNGAPAPTSTTSARPKGAKTSPTSTTSAPPKGAKTSPTSSNKKAATSDVADDDGNDDPSGADNETPSGGTPSDEGNDIPTGGDMPGMPTL
ncbi:hypothetical protein HDU81_006176 [Chytriomyces hyalinus]|nr:hypothetical protein HDU81_006176 [Chytriomyces hyalinus]